MRPLLMALIAVVLGAAGSPRREPDTTLVTGTVRAAITGAPLTHATLIVGPYFDSTQTDSTGRFTIRVPRETDVVWFYKAGFLDFRFPLLRITTDTLVVAVELRTDPPPAKLWNRLGGLEPVCARHTLPERLELLSTCDWKSDPPPGVQRRMYKHNPFSPYFGRSGDIARVIVETRTDVRAEQRD